MVHVLYFIYGIVRFFRRHCFLKPLDLAERYGKGSWALVTGASDGIGKEYCLQLAQKGFNVCLVSRTREKLEAVEKEIKSKTSGSGVQTCLIQFDFEGATTMDAF